MMVRVYIVGLAKTVASVLLGGRPERSKQGLGDLDDEDEDRDTLPEAGLAVELGRQVVAEMRIELSGTDADARTHHLMSVLERDVRELTAGWDCRVDVTPEPTGSPRIGVVKETDVGRRSHDGSMRGAGETKTI